MIIESSISGIFRTVILIIGGYVVLKFIGQLMIAKRDQEEVDRNTKSKNNFDKELKAKKESIGKTTIINKKASDKSTSSNSIIEDVDYEEIN